MKARLLSPIFPVILSVLFLGISTPLLFASQAGASSGNTTGSIFIIVDKDPTSPSSLPEVYEVSVSSSEIPLNAFYLVLNYDAKEMSCGNPKPNESDFPLLLESLSDESKGEVVFALAQPGLGITSTTTLGSVMCTKTQDTRQHIPTHLVLNPESKAYAADGFGTELGLVQR